jgi:hypothetical protein
MSRFTPLGGCVAPTSRRGHADHRVEEVIDFYPSREEAEETLKQVLQDEPGWAGVLEVVSVELGSASAN